MKMKQTMLFILIFIIIVISVRCDTTEPPAKGSISLTVEDASCTEAWLKLTTTNFPLPTSVVLKQNDATRTTINLITPDTLLYIDSLLPKQTYTFQVSSTQHQVSSNQATTTTLDTTSHNFTWQTFTFGEHTSSVLYDVAVINENNIWAVGEIYMKDSLGNNDPNAYNAVHWDGQSWNLKRIMFYTICGQSNLSSYPAKAIFAFNKNDIWIAMDGDQLARVNGTTQVSKQCLPWSFVINKLWGSSSNDLYAVGNGGNIAHYSNGVWTKIEIQLSAGQGGTTVDLLDVWGSPDGSIVWACGYTGDYALSALIRIKNNISETLFEGFSNSQSNGYYVGPMNGVWLDNEYRIFMMTWGGIYSIRNSNSFFLDKRIARISDVGFGSDGTASNNLFACGEGFVGHWNGYSYKEYPELFIQQRVFKNIKANINTVCAVGTDYNSPIYSNAVIVLGK
jgi:hypothetical protein